MTTETHITAGLQAAAGARPGARPGTSSACARTTFASYAPAVHPVSVHQTTWIKGATGEPSTFMVLDAKNRPARPLSELSP
ncbi:MAG: hypothetical protein ACJ739_17650 [Acidimicrobiales bacterium]